MRQGAGLRAGAGRVLAALTVLLAAMLAAAAPAPAQDQPETEALLGVWDEENTRIGQVLDRNSDLSAEVVGQLREALERQRAEMRAERSRVDERASPFRQQIEALGPPPEEGETEPAGVATERARLNDALAEIEAEGKQIDLALARTGTLLAELADIRARQFTDDLITAGPSPLDPDTWARAAADLGVAADRILAESRRAIDEGGIRLIEPLILITLGLILGVVIRRLAIRWLLGRVPGEDSFLRRSLIAAGIAAARLFLPVLALVMFLTALSMSGILGSFTPVAVSALGRAVLIVIGAYVFTGIYFAPYAPQLRLSGFPDDCARRSATLTIRIAAVFVIDRFLQTVFIGLGLATQTLVAVNLVLLVIGCWLLWRLATVFNEVLRSSGDERPMPEPEEGEPGPEPVARSSVRILTRIFQLVAIVAPVLAVIGYYAASRYAFYPMIATTAIFGVCLVIARAARVLVENSLQSDEEGGPRRGRNRLRLLPIVLGFVLMVAAIPALVLVWGGDTTDIVALWGMARGGFHIGDVEINVGDVLTLGVVFTIGYLLTRTLQSVVRRTVLPNAGMDSGAAAAVSAGIGYAGIFIAALVAISAAGLDLSNLAIVAGALGVGIGFGLQNIVNNFVSGIILLIERPIKVGDWVELASGQGYVRHIRVRATEIQTFDRASLFVPNSELISGAVTNWTHANTQGRIIVKVGVAYGSDVRKVERILLEIAEAHSMIVNRPGPYVIMTSFGADSLDFEIRGVLRDINWILNVTSDINFEIYRRFAEEGVEVPFRQHDIHVKDLDRLVGALGARAQAEQPGDMLQARRPKRGEDDSDGDERGHRGDLDSDGDADGDGR